MGGCGGSFRRAAGPLTVERRSRYGYRRSRFKTLQDPHRYRYETKVPLLQLPSGGRSGSSVPTFDPAGYVVDCRRMGWLTVR
jgi:hypothetical protein